MAITDQLGEPGLTSKTKGRFTLDRFVLSEATVAAPVTPTNLSYLVAVDVSDPSFSESEIFHHGGGDESTSRRSDYKWPITLTVLNGKKASVLAQLRNITWNTSNDAAIFFRQPNFYPKFHLECAIRDFDNATHLYSVFLQDVIIDEEGWTNPLDETDLTIKAFTKHMPAYICQGAEMVYDEFTGDGSRVNFTLSSTPLNLATASNYDDLILDDVFFVKKKLSTESTGTRQTSGISYSGGVVTFTTAPAVSSTVQILYARRS